MKRLTSSIALLPFLASTVFAGPIFMNDPSEDLMKMQQYFNSMIDKQVAHSSIMNYNYPRTNIQDKEKEIIIEFDLAGVEKKDIKLSIDSHNILTLMGKNERSVEEKDKDGKYVRQEIFHGNFQKSIQLPENVLSDKLVTNYEKGILTITVPKTEIKKENVKVIPIN